MKTVIDSERLREAVRHASRCAGHIRVGVCGGSAYVGAAGRTLSVRVALGTAGGPSGDGAVLIPSDRFRAIAAELPEGPVTVGYADGRADVVYAGGRLTVPAEPVEDVHGELPCSPGREEAGGGLVMDAAPFVSAVCAAARCASGSTPYPVMEHVVIEDDGQGRAVFVGSDLRSLLAVRRGVSRAPVRAVALHRDIASLLPLLLSAGDGPVEVTDDGRRVLVRRGGVSLSARGCTGSYPNWRKVFPERPGTEVAARTADLAAGVRRVSVFAEPLSPSVDIRTDGENLRIAGRCPAAGTRAVETCGCRSLRGGPLAGRYSAERLLSGLRCMAEEDVYLRHSGGMSPLLIGSGDGAGEVSFLLMPLADGGGGTG